MQLLANLKKFIIKTSHKISISKLYMEYINEKDTTSAYISYHSIIILSFLLVLHEVFGFSKKEWLNKSFKNKLTKHTQMLMTRKIMTRINLKCTIAKLIKK